MKTRIVSVSAYTVLILVYLWLRMAQPTMVTRGELRTMLALCYVGLSMLLAHGLCYLLLDVFFERRKGRQAPQLLRFLLSAIVYGVAFVAIYSLVLQRDLSAIASTSAVATVVIGLALQDTLGNFFAGVALHIEQPFHINDTIRVDALQGCVESVTWRTTSIRTADNTLVIFPNSKVARESLHVYPINNLTRHILEIPVPPSVSPQSVIGPLTEAVAALPEVSSATLPIVRLSKFAESSIIYEVVYWVSDYTMVTPVDALIRERVWYWFHRASIRLPHPVLQLQHAPPQPARKNREDHHNLFDEIGLFDPLSPEERSQLGEQAERLLYAPGETIIHSGTPGDSMFVIRQGRVRVSVVPRPGTVRAVADLGPGDFFGEMALFTGEPRSAEVVAIDEAELLEVTKDSLEHLLRANDQLAEAFSRKIAQRRTVLAALDNYIPASVEELQPATILLRIRRFFSLQ